MKDPKGHGSNKRGERMPIPGHPYHGKSDEELRYIAKDAHEAGRNAHEMGDMKGVNKYADQVADASTVLGYRGRSGSGPISNSTHAVVDHPKSNSVPTHDAHAGVGPNDPRAGSRDYDAFGRPRADKSSYDEYSRDLSHRSRNGGIGSGGRR